jgi:hypothetical protein
MPWRCLRDEILGLENDRCAVGRAFGGAIPGVAKVLLHVSATPNSAHCRVTDSNATKCAPETDFFRTPLILLSHKIRHRVFVYLNGRKMRYLGLSFSGSGDRNGRRLE